MLMNIHLVATAFELTVILLPFIGLMLFKAQREQVISRTRLLMAFNRLQNVMLIISVATGAWLWGTLYFNWWLGMVIALLLAFGAGLGLMSRALKGILAKAQNGQPYADSIRQYVTVSAVIAVAIAGLVIFKTL